METKTIDIYKEIGEYIDWWTGENYLYGFKDLVSELKDIDPNANLKLRINSMGGSVLDGISIYNSIRGHKGKTEAEIVGYAMSISSVFPLACDVVKMASTAWIVIHEARVQYLDGDFEAGDLNDLASVIEGHNDNIAAIYAAKMKITKTEAREMMKGETWINAKQAKKLGLVDEITKGVSIAAKIDMAQFKNMPESVKNTIIENNIKIQNKMEFNKNLVAAFGVTEAEAKAGDFSKIEAAMATLNKISDVAGLEARVKQNEETLDKSTEYVDGKIAAVEATLKNTTVAMMDFEAEEASPLVAEIKALKAENEALKTKVETNSGLIAEKAATIEGLAVGMANNSMNKAESFFQRTNGLIKASFKEQS